MNYYWYGEHGKLIQAGYRISLEDAQAAPLSATFPFIESAQQVDRLEKYYVSNGELTEKPARPDAVSKWDYATQQWADQRTLEQHKTARWAEIKAIREANEFGGFTWDGSEFDSDAISQARIQGAVVLAMQALGAEVPFSIDWTLKNNSVRSLTGTQMVAVGQALATHVGTQHEIARILRVSIEESVSVPEVEAVIWP